MNPVIHLDQYPLLCIDDIFASLRHGERFSKTDLAQAYLQMKIEQSSNKYLTINTHRGSTVQLACVWHHQHPSDLATDHGRGPSVRRDTRHTMLLKWHYYLWQTWMQFWQDRSSKSILDWELRKCKKMQVFQRLHLVLWTQDREDWRHPKAPPPGNVSQLCSFLGHVDYYHKFMPNH